MENWRGHQWNHKQGDIGENLAIGPYRTERTFGGDK